MIHLEHFRKKLNVWYLDGLILNATCRAEQGLIEKLLYTFFRDAAHALTVSLYLLRDIKGNKNPRQLTFLVWKESLIKPGFSRIQSLFSFISHLCNQW